jgi:hypothetical protein
MALPASQHPYNALLPNHIRLLMIHEDTRTGFRYDLIDTPLDDAPSYEALSYVWGNQDRSLALQLGSTAIVLVTSSLGETLRYLSAHCTSGYLWVDQICINQTDWNERSQQVEIMGDIYSKAKRVLIWLGRDETDAIELTSSASTVYRKCIAVRNILELPWFHRGWVVQEAMLPPKVTFFLGTRSFGIAKLWKHVIKARDREEDHGSYTPGVPSIRQMPGCFVLLEINNLRRERRDGRRGCFYYTLSTLAPRCRTTRPEDSIFGFLGLVMDPRIHMTVDYNMDLEAIPTVATREIIRDTESLDVFGSIHRVLSYPSAWPDLPSWVPHWTRPLGSEAMVYYKYPNYFNASCGRRHTEPIPMASDRSHLIVSGRKIDEIQLVFALKDIPNPNSNRCGWDAYEFLDLTRLDAEIRSVWSVQEAAVTTARLLVTLLADGSFVFSEKERERCRDGLSKARIEELSDIYYGLRDPVPTEWSCDQQEELKASRNTFRDHARVAWGQSVIVGERWRLGLTHQSVERGDIICTIHGSKVPLVLRCVGDKQFRLVGQCYFEGAMRGEEAGGGDKHVDQFVIV